MQMQRDVFRGKWDWFICWFCLNILHVSSTIMALAILTIWCSAFGLPYNVVVLMIVVAASFLDLKSHFHYFFLLVTKFIFLLLMVIDTTAFILKYFVATV